MNIYVLYNILLNSGGFKFIIKNYYYRGLHLSIFRVVFQETKPSLGAQKDIFGLNTLFQTVKTAHKPDRQCGWLLRQVKHTSITLIYSPSIDSGLIEDRETLKNKSSMVGLQRLISDKASRSDTRSCGMRPICQPGGRNCRP